MVRSYASVAVWCTGLVLLAYGCVASPHLGKDEGREAVVWQHQPLAAPATPTPSAASDSEAALLAQLHEAEGKGDDLAVAGMLYNLAILRRQQGASAEAERLYRGALGIRERRQGPNHPDVAVVLNNLATLEAAQENYAAALPLFERALRIRQLAFGDEHVLTAESLNNLALLHAAQGNAAIAEPLYQRAVAILEQMNAADRSASYRGELGRVLDNYAALLHDTGRDTEAAALEARARVTGAGQPPDAGR